MTTNVSSTIILGIVSGILTTVMLYIIGNIFTKIIIPWYQKLIYHGIDLNGEWRVENQLDCGKEQFLLSIVQNANNVSGQLLYIQQINDKYIEINYLLNGSVWEGYLTLNMKSKNRREIAYSTSLLKVEKGGHELKGFQCFRNFETDQVDKVELLYKRT